MPEKQDPDRNHEDRSGRLKRSTVAYISDLLEELERLARLENCERLACLLHAARREARRLAGS